MAALFKVLVGSGGDGTVSSLANDLRLDVAAVAQTNLTLEGSGNQNITVHFENLGRVVKQLCLVRVTTEGTGLAVVLVKLLDIQTVGIVNRAVPFANAYDGSTTHPNFSHVRQKLFGTFHPLPVVLKELGGVVADITETLNHHTRISDLARKTRALLHLRVVQELTNALQEKKKKR